MAERLARAEEWIDGHERRCEERQVAMGREIRDLKDSTQGLTKGAWGVVLALLAWMAVQLYSDLKHPPQTQSTAVTVTSPQR